MKIPARVIREKHAIADALEASGHHETAEKLRSCHEKKELVFCRRCAKTWYVVIHCRQRICPICSYQTAWQRAIALIELAKRTKHPKLITLTISRWKGSPRNGIVFLREAFNALRKTPLFKNVKGGAYQIELKRKPDGWHIHLHALLDSPYIPYQHLFSRWTEIVGQCYAAVWISAAKSEKEIAYVCKYASKAAGFEGTPDDAVAWWAAVKGSRLFTTFGDYYSIKLDELLNDKNEDQQKYVCPHCGQPHTMIRARDGPYALGRELWASAGDTIINGQPLEIPNEDLTLLSDEDNLQARKHRKEKRKNETRSIATNPTAHLV